MIFVFVGVLCRLVFNNVPVFSINVIIIGKTLKGCSAGRIAHCEGPRPSFACPYIRVSFASATDADLQEGIKRLATVIKTFQQESAAGPSANGNVITSNGHATLHGSLSNGNHSNTHSDERSVQQIVHDNKQMGLDAAVHTAADSQPEAC